ncbi:MAG: hypothetical protein AVDCRST_MAG93-8366, partial [uncultured Chloroflexia bacterium]
EQTRDRLGVTHAQILSSEDASTEHISHQIDGFVAFVRLNAVNRDDQAAVCSNLFVPCRVVGNLMGCTNQGRIGIEEVRDFTARDGLLKRCETRLEHLVGLVKGVMVGKAKMANQNDDVKAKGKAGQGEGICGGTAVGPSGGGAGRVGTTVAAVGEANGTRKGDDRALGEGGIAAKASATGQAGGELRAVDALGEVGEDFRATHCGTSSWAMTGNASHCSV